MLEAGHEALLELIVQKLREVGWSDFSFADVAQDAALSLAEVHAVFASKEDVLSVIFRRLDQEMLESAHLEDLSSLKERLFELVACRLECLDPYRSIAKDLYESSISDPCLYFLLSQKVKKSLLWMMTASGCRPKGFSQVLFLNTFFSLYIVIFYKWLQDQTKDKAPTLSFLDKSLARISPLFQAFEKVY